jgi:hypothetical protein
MEFLNRAILDTFSGKMRAGFLAILGAIFAFVFLWYWKGSTVAFDEIPFILTGIAGGIGALAVLFLWNLACAPYRIEKERHQQTKKLIPEPYTEKLAPKRPSEAKILAGILNRKDTFTLWESASLMVDKKLNGGLSETGQALLTELRIMMRDGKIKRVDQPTNLEKMGNLQRNLGRAIIGDEPVLIPWSSAKISREQLFEISVELSLPISGLKP